MTKITTEVNGKKVTITLTKDQLEDIRLQTSKFNKYTDIKSVLDAIQHLKNIGIPAKSEELLTASGRIKVVTRAINSLINNEKFPDFKNKLQNKYYPTIKWDGKSWVVFVFFFYRWRSYLGSGFTKNSESALYLGNQFLDLYIEAMNEY